MDNQDPSKTGNQDPVTTTQTTTEPAPPATNVPSETFTWKDKLAPDYANSPTMKLFPDTKEGFNDAIKSHLSLQKMIGHEKVVIPKGKDDLEARALFNKAMGIPDKPEGYGLPDLESPESMKGVTFDKATFAKIVHDNNLTPEQAKNLWTSYTEMTKGAYAKAVESHKQTVTNAINELRNLWGDAYQSKVDLGQMVINKFSESKEMNDYITATLIKDPQGIKFLANIGDQFAENKIGDFKYQRNSLTPEEAQAEIDRIKSDPNHPYLNPKATDKEHQEAVNYVNSLISSIKKSKG